MNLIDSYLFNASEGLKNDEKEMLPTRFELVSRVDSHHFHDDQGMGNSDANLCTIAASIGRFFDERRRI